jgi:endonuclease/exonuclease/phosphatase family metal-dependent hydrolase
VEIDAITWNLFHGRDFPPDPALFTWRSRLLRTTERNGTHVQLNRDLFDEFAQLLAAARWDLALLQECPPRWSAPLAKACDAMAQRSLTSRNWLAPVRTALARRNPDLLGSWEGGSNLTLARGSLAPGPADQRQLVLRRLPERRTMAFARHGSTLCVANMHASASARRAEEDVRTAAEAAIRWADDLPLVFGGDLNVRPDRSGLFDELARRFDLRAPTAGDAIDHILARGLEIVARPIAWPPGAREVACDGLAVPLSDHAPVAARFRSRDAA